VSPPRRPGDDRRAGNRPDTGASRDRRDASSRGDRPAKSGAKDGKPRDGAPPKAAAPQRVDRAPSPVRPPHRNAPPRDGAPTGAEKKKPNRASVRSFHRNAARDDAPPAEAAPAKRAPRAAARPATERAGSPARLKRNEAFTSRRDAERREEEGRQPARPARAPTERVRPDRARPQAADRPLRRDAPTRDDRADRPLRPDRPAASARPPRGEAPARGGDRERPARPADGDRKRPERAAPAVRVRRDGSVATGRGAARHALPATALAPSSPASKHAPQRIAKLLARSGIASRREIERMIEEGRIAIDGTPLATPATIVTTLRGITVDGEPVAAPSATRLFLFHKPTGFLTAERDPEGRPTIYDRLPPGLPRLMPIGRLDLNTEGLLLLTTDGEFKRKLELPSSGIPRVYRARAYGEVTQQQLEALIEGVEIDGMRYGQIDANMERRTGRNVWIEMKITEGKNREVRRVLEYLGLQVSRLIRVAYGPFVLADLAPGGVVEVLQHDLVAFRQTLR
jgi:23S rRNA pseudouridine2605 synthase